MLVDTARVSLAWHPAAPHGSEATRRSPGFTNFTYSADSLSHLANTSGAARPRSRKTESRGWMCAFRFAARYSGEFVAVPTPIPRAGTAAVTIRASKLNRCRRVHGGFVHRRMAANAPGRFSLGFFIRLTARIVF